MPNPEEMMAAVHRYVEAFDKGDPEMAASLYANDATIEDPIGTPIKEGIGAIREFYQESMVTGAKLALQPPIRVGADYAAFAFQVQLNMGGNDMSVDVIDTFRFNNAGKVIEMKAFWGPTNMKGM